MHTRKYTQWALIGLTAIAVALFVGCGSSETAHSHEGHDHSHEGEGAETHLAETEGAEVAGKLDEAASTATLAVKAYPLEVCIVGGDELGSMGEPITLNHEGQEVKFCCENCVPKFKENPAEYLTALTKTTPTE